MSEISKTIQLICSEKGLKYEVVLEAVEVALAAAYRKDFGHKLQNIKVKFDPETADMVVWDEKIVVEDIETEKLEQDQEELMRRREEARAEGRELTEEDVADLVHFNPKTEMMLKEARQNKKGAAVGDIIKISLDVPHDFGRMAAQTAKQVIIQKLREAERLTVFDDFKNLEGTIVQGIIQRRDKNGSVLVDLGKITGIMPYNEQIAREMYRSGSKMKFYIGKVEMGIRGPEIILSRSNVNMVKTIFENEIPEITDGVVEIKNISRDAGNRSKVAVHAEDDSIDPIGACVGQRGSRITTIIDELGGEKVDIIHYSKKAEDYIANALSPAKVSKVELEQDSGEANVTVPADQFSLAIGRGGQNVRLAAELTGWKINVLQTGEEKVVVSSESNEEEIEEILSGEETEDKAV